jgi:calcineurin-like phosphoesterase family protein
MELKIVHLSDIHFRNEDKLIGINSDDNMREDVVRELIRFSNEFGAIDAMIVSGDIAFSGKIEEFAIARKWLYSILERTRSPNAKIIVCPGNHDVDQAVLNDAILDMHDKVRSEKDVEKRQSMLLARLGKEQSRDLLMSALGNYNDFAVEFACEFYPDRSRYTWFHDLTLNDGSTLRVRGLNSTILCGLKDAKHSLFLGRNSWSLKKEDGVEYLVFAHHPPSWLYDEVEMKNELDDKARIQMYGHEHAARIDAGVDSVRLFAGAINPERDHAGWMPGFNFLRLEVCMEREKRMLSVITHSMQWQNTSPSQFVMYKGKHADGTHRQLFALSPWSAPPSQATNEPSSRDALESPTTEARKMPEPKPEFSEQMILRLFFDLNFATQTQILDKLGLLEKADSGLPHFMQIKNALKRAKERDLFKNLLNEIQP